MVHCLGDDLDGDHPNSIFARLQIERSRPGSMWKLIHRSNLSRLQLRHHLICMVPAGCFDKELMDQFLAVHDWKWYLDGEGQQAVDIGSVAAGQYDQAYVTQEYHMYPCTYMWTEMRRIILSETVLDGYIGDAHHMADCEMQILDQSRPLDAISTPIYTKYVTCPIKQDFQGWWGWYLFINGRRI